MRILAILFLILSVSSVKADEIYNLIKIRNLEIYKLNTQYGIKYLNTKGNFKLGIDENISAKEQMLKIYKINLK